MGVSRGVSVSPDVSSVRESAGQRAAGAGWLTRSRDGGSFRRLLPAALDELAAPDLVGGDGGQSAAAGNVWVINGCQERDAHLCAACASGLDALCDSKRSCRDRADGSHLFQGRRRNYTGGELRQRSRLPGGVRAFHEFKCGGARSGNERQASAVSRSGKW